MNSPMVSILMTSYNREKYIAESIESVLASSYDNFELIITDNCSTDTTYEIIKKYESIDKRIRAYQNSENIGQFPNRNYAASLAKGSYLKYVDSDDLIYPYGLAILVKAALRFPLAGLIASSSLNENSPCPIQIEPKESYRMRFISGGFVDVGPTDTLIKNEAFKMVKGFSVPSYAGTDSELTLKIAAQFPIVKCEPGVAWYREHEGQEIKIAYLNYDYELNNYNCYMGLLNAPACPLNEDEKFLAVVKLRKLYIRYLIKLVLKMNFQLSNKIYRIIRPSVREIVTALR